MAIARKKANVQLKIGEPIDAEEQWIRRRLPRHLPRRPNDLYVNNSSNYKNQLSRGQSVLLESGWLVVHGFGSAVPRAIHLSLDLQSTINEPTTAETRTSTVYLTDDIEPIPWVEGNDLDNQVRSCPAIHVRITTASTPKNKNKKEGSDKPNKSRETQEKNQEKN